MDWIKWLRIGARRGTFVITVMNLQVPYNTGNVSTK
jgi:hypothetical protein